MNNRQESPNAILRLWWRIPNWSRALPALGGSLLAPLALMSMHGHTVQEAPEVATPGKPAASPVPAATPSGIPAPPRQGTVTTNAKPPPAPANDTIGTPSNPALPTPTLAPAGTPAVVGAPCAYQGQVAAYADDQPTVCALTPSGELRWRRR